LNDVAISVENLSKRFRIPLDHSTTLKYRMTHFRSSSRYRDFLALDDVSFDVPAGQFLGITGPNGCGKSSLLKILSRIYTPNAGRVVINGHVSPFLELGVGFNPELTARENIFLGGAVLGLTRKELAQRVDPVLEFAELTEFADQKLKNFSSGMSVRLAFSVAIQADAGILLMDEVLAVGDARFQQKCFEVFARYKREGRTVILVSHDLTSLNLYCDRVLLLQNGKLISDGEPGHVTAEYRRIVGAMSDQDDRTEEPATKDRWGSRKVEITGTRLLDGSGKEHHTFLSDAPLTVEVDYEVKEDVGEFICGMAFDRSDGFSLAAPNNKFDHFRLPAATPGSAGTITYTMESLPLLNGQYQITVALHDMHFGEVYDCRVSAADFMVVDEDGRLGVMNLGGKWSSTQPMPAVAISEGV
jgi:lipopolysaccharide transport system ATP-binding protein